MTTDKPAAERSAGGLFPCGTSLPPRVTDRADFLAAARARTMRLPGFMLQARDRADGAPPRVGFTCSKKVGNAVARNRAKRRLREVARLTVPALGQPGWDYILIGRRDVTATRDLDRMCRELANALRELHH